MIRTDDDFQPTMWAVQSDDHWPPRRPFIPQGCDQQGRLTPTIEPAHAASEYDEPDTHEDSGGCIVWPLVVGVALLAAVILGAHFGAGL